MNEIQIIDLREQFFRVSNKVFEQNLDSYGIALYTAICRYVNNDTKMAYPSISKLAEMCNMSKRKAIEVIKDLINKGVIYKKTGSYTTSNKYYLLSLPTNSPALVNESNQGSACHALGVVNEVHTKKTNNIKTNYKDLIPDSLNTNLFIQTWDEWTKYRKEIKHPLKPTTIKKQLLRLEKVGPDMAIKMLNQSMEHGWQGIFDLKQDYKDYDRFKTFAKKEEEELQEYLEEAREKEKIYAAKRDHKKHIEATKQIPDYAKHLIRSK